MGSLVEFVRVEEDDAPLKVDRLFGFTGNVGTLATCGPLESSVGARARVPVPVQDAAALGKRKRDDARGSSSSDDASCSTMSCEGASGPKKGRAAPTPFASVPARVRLSDLVNVGATMVVRSTAF